MLERVLDPDSFTQEPEPREAGKHAASRPEDGGEEECESGEQQEVSHESRVTSCETQQFLWQHHNIRLA
jgi:hypothetical protein